MNGYAPPDQTYSGDLGDGQGLALFATTSVADFATATPLDAVGFVGIEPPYSEGTPLASPGANDGEYSFVRKLSGTGLPKDTNDNASDFAFVSTNGGSYGGVQSTLGAPGPENSQSPVQRNAQIKASLPDPQCVASNSPTSACARVRDASDTGPNKTNGTLSFRRRFTNKTGFAITKLRFRIVDITTTGGRAMSEADLRALSSSTITVTDSNNQSVTVLGTTVETPPTQSMGGGLNSSLVVMLPAPLGTNNSVVAQLVTGVEAGGTAVIGVDDAWCEAAAERVERSGKKVVRVSARRRLDAGLYAEGSWIIRAIAVGEQPAGAVGATGGADDAEEEEEACEARALGR